MVIASVVNIAAFAAPIVMGPSALSFGVLNFLFGIGAAFAGESVYKVWSQELFPTLLRSTAQGVTLAVARVVAALFAFVTPALLVESPTVLLWTLLACAVVSSAIGTFWVPRLKAPAELDVVGSRSQASEADPARQAH